MQKKIGKDDIEFSFFRDFWAFYEKYYYPEPNDKYWENVVKESDMLVKKYQNVTIARKLLLAIIQELEERSMNMR